MVLLLDWDLANIMRHEENHTQPHVQTHAHEWVQERTRAQGSGEQLSHTDEVTVRLL